jgi:hypothetical protein
VEVRRGNLTADFDLFAVNHDEKAATIRVGLGRTAGPIEGRGSGSVVLITFRIRTQAQPGKAIVNLRRAVGDTFTQLNDGGLDLNPDPRDRAGDRLDGLIQVQRQARDRALAAWAGQELVDLLESAARRKKTR